MDMAVDPEHLRKEIDDTLAELERLEVEVMELFREVLGPDAAARVEAYKRAKASEPGLRLLSSEASPEPWTGPPGTR